MEDQVYSYSWHGTSRTPSKALSKPNTPSRSSRRSGYLNLTHYNAFTRSDGIKFEVGDVVQIWEGIEYTPAQVWLDPYRRFGAQSVQSLRRQQALEGPEAGPSSSRLTPRKRGGRAGKGSASIAQRAQEDGSEDWIPEDGLEDPVKFAVIIDLFEDEQENMRIAVHWLARPRLLCYFHGKEDSVEEGLNECHSRELVYTFNPNEDSTKHKTSKPSASEDIIDVSYVLNPIKVVSYAQYQAENQSESTYFIRKAMNIKFDAGEGWYFDIDWQVVYEKARASGNWELKTASSKTRKDTSCTKGKKAPSKSKSTITKSAKKRQKVVKSIVEEVTGDLPKTSKVLKYEDNQRSSRASSVETDIMDESDIESSSEDEDEEDARTDVDFRSEAGSDDENEEEDDFDLDIPSSSDDDNVSRHGKEEDSDYGGDDVFGSRSASSRKRKAGSLKTSPIKGGKLGRTSRGGRSKYDNDVGDEIVVLKPSAATLRKNAALAERRQRRLAERQARRLQPRLPLVQQRNSGVEGVDTADMTPFEKARAALHVGCTPDYLPCRDGEYAEVEAYLEDAIDEGVGSCIYIAGVPGTGKTATVRSVISSLQQRANDKEIKPFRFLEINGMKITDPAQSFSILWEFISGNRTSAKQALSSLETHFKTPSPNRDTCVVLVDELDQLVTKKQEVIYNFFNWPNQSHSKLIVLAIANTMDLPERELSNKINSRLGSNRINFTPYDKNQLIEILTNRLEGLENGISNSSSKGAKAGTSAGGVFAKDAIGLVAGKVAGVTGDARRALDICRRAVEKVEAENLTRIQEGKEGRLVNAGDIVLVHKEMTSSGLLLYVKRAGLHQRIMLLALSRAIRKIGVADEVEFGDIIRWHIDFCRQTAINPLPTHTQLFSILQSLSDMRLITLEGGNSKNNNNDYFQRVQANVRDDELELVFRKEQRFSHYLR